MKFQKVIKQNKTQKEETIKGEQWTNVKAKKVKMQNE